MDDIELYDEDVHSEENDPEAHEAFVAFQNAKAKYNDVLKARGTNTGSREDSLARAKARSYCSACGKKGHWHRDPDCPKNKTKVSGPTPHTTHLVYYTDGDPLDVIVDCACSRTLAGSAWVRAYIDLLKDYKIDYIIVEQDEAFKFGGPKIYPSSRAVVSWLKIHDKWFMIKISIVAAGVPLLISRPALAKLGMNYRMERNVADFTNLGLTDVQLSFTGSGHPRVAATDFGDVVHSPIWPEAVDWSVTEVHIPFDDLSARRAYMSARLPQVTKLFYPKVAKNIQEFLQAEVLSSEVFLQWWKDQPVMRDFWIETETEMIRVHVTPRRTYFNPSKWQTSSIKLKEQLLKRLGHVRETTCIPCYGKSPTVCVEHQWQERHTLHAECLWIGRSRFGRRRSTDQATCPIRDPSDVSDECHSNAMEDEPLRAGGHLDELKVPIRAEWTVPELRATLLEALETRGDTKNKLVGITKMTFDQLKEKCLLEGIVLPEKPTRGTMMKMLRDNLPPTDEEKVCFGSFKGYLYKEVNEGYLEWAQREVKENPNHSPDLARLARWAQARGDLPGAPSGSGDPELSAKVPVPKAVLPKAKAELKNPNKTTRTSRTRPVTSESDMGFSEVEMPMDQQIQDLEARLEIMRTVAKSEKEAAARMETGASQK